MSDCGETVYLPLEPYATVDDLCGACKNVDLGTEEAPSEDRAAFELKLLYASRRVYIATGGRWTGCVTTKWMPGCRDNWPCCGRSTTDSCGCSGDFILLPDGAIRSIVEVKIDGVALDAVNYVLEGRHLYRIDGERWPALQTSGVDDTVVGSWSITYRTGIDVPPEAKPLIADYACEMVKACKPNTNCALPKGYRMLQIGNAVYEMPDPMDYRIKFLTGYQPLDDWIVAIMAGHARTRPRMAGRRPEGRRTA